MPLNCLDGGYERRISSKRIKELENIHMWVERENT